MHKDNAIRIAMWSGPRNISTTMMRSFENRPDAIVADEPFYGCYLKASGADHPYREEILAAQPTNWRAVVKNLQAPLPAGKSVLFEKHIAYHYPDGEPLDWLLTHRTFLLIRDPRLMVASYAKKSAEVAPIVESYAVAGRIHDFLAQNRVPCPIVDATDILNDPPGMIGALCSALGIPFTEKMLSWPAGARQSDGVWAPYWYDAVIASTGFKRPVDKAVELSPDLERASELAAKDYQFLAERRLIAPK